MQNKRVLQQTASAAREGIRKRGRPCKRWWDKVENNLNVMGINNRQAMARDSWECRWIVLKAQGPQQIVLPEEEQENFNMKATYFIFSYVFIRLTEHKIFNKLINCTKCI
jgi:hypothetical protein